MIRNVDVPRERWALVLQSINRLLLGRPVRVEVADRDLGDQELAREMPLRVLEEEAAGSAAGDIVLAVGGDGRDLTHRIAKPQAMALGRDTETGEVESVAWQDGNGDTTVVYFEPTAGIGVREPEERAPPG